MTATNRNATTTVRPDSTAYAQSELDLIFTRTIHARRALVWKAYTDPKLIVQWWGPKGFTNPFCEMDLRPGGIFRILMRGPDGTEYPNRGVYQEVVPEERLVLTNDWDDDRPSQEFLMAMTFADLGDKTLITARMSFKSIKDRDDTLKHGAVEGFAQCMDRLEAYVQNA